MSLDVRLVESLRDQELSQREKTKLAIEAVHEKVRNFQSSVEFKEFLDYYRQLNRYSPANTMFLMAQAAERGVELSQVLPKKGRPVLKKEGGKNVPVRDEDGYRQVHSPGWNAYGRQIKKGEKAFYVFRPIFVDREKVDPERYSVRDRKDPKKVLVGYTLKDVYDISQTVGEPLRPAPEIIRDIPAAVATADDVAAFQESLEKVIADQGFSVSYTSFKQDGLYGRTNYDYRLVQIAEGLSPAQTVETLAHELGHIVFDHENRREGEGIHRGEREVEAETYAYLALREIGIDSGEFSVGYLATWAKDDPDALLRSVDRVSKKAVELVEHPEVAKAIEQVRDRVVGRVAEEVPTMASEVEPDSSWIERDLDHEVA